MAKGKAKSKATAKMAKVATPISPIKTSDTSIPAQVDPSAEDEAKRSSSPADESKLDIDVSDLPDLEGDDEGSAAPASASNVVVCARVRPAPEAQAEGEKPWTLDPEQASIEATEQHPSIAKRTGSSAPPPSASLNTSASMSLLAESASSANLGETYKFNFDSLASPDVTSLENLYTNNISPVVSGAVQGFNGTVFAYGQTGSGKTYTMSGGGGEEGIIARAINEVFRRVEQTPEREFLLRVSYLEIYNESLRDLLLTLPSSSSSGALLGSSERPSSPIKGGYSHSSGSSAASSAGSTLRITEQPSSGRVTIAGLREEIVTQPAHVMQLLAKGQAARHQAATDWNERSSRSHCVATLTIESRLKEVSNGAVRVSALNLIDLAGSEKAASEKERRKEGAFINKSLLTLGSVISKLSAAATNPAAAAHIPYRDSKLTRLLQTSLSGNARVAVLLTISPLTQHAVEGLSTLKFGKRCKMIKLKAKRDEIGEGDSGNEALLRRYKREVERLRAKLEAEAAAAANKSPSQANSPDIEELQERKKAAEVEVERMAERKAELRAQMEHLTRLIVTSNSVAESRRQEEQVLQDAPSSSGALKAAPSTPLRRARLSEFGTPGTPKGSMSPLRRPGSIEEVPGPTQKPFAVESEIASLRKNLTSALEAKDRSEAARAEEAEAWSRRVEQLEETLQGAEANAEEKSREYAAREHVFSENVLRIANLEERLKAEETSRAAEQEAARTEYNLLRAQLDQMRTELKAEKLQREAAEETLKKRPETEEEVTQREFDEIVKPARDAEEAKMGKSPLLQAAAALSPSGSSSANGASSASDHLTARAAELDEREAQLVQREVEVSRLTEEAAKKPMPPVSRPLPVPCTHQTEIDTLRKSLTEHESKIESLSKLLAEEQAKVKEAAAASTFHRLTSSPSSSGKLREAFWKSESTTTPTKASSSTMGIFGKPTAALHRGGSVREYRRYQAPMASSPSMTGASASGSPPSMTTSASRLGALSLATPAAASNAMAIEAAVKAEREEIERLNAVIGSQRSLMADLEHSVGEWKSKMRSQQDIIKQLIGGGGNWDSSDGDAHVPLSAAAVLRAQETPPAAAAKPPHRQMQPLRSSGRSSNGADDFSKRRSAFLGSSEDKAALATGARGRGGSSQGGSTSTPGSGPYYGAHTFNRPPGSGNGASGVMGLGVAAPSSPTKGSGLWSNAHPEPLPLPTNLTPSKARRARRITIEHELEKIKNSSPRVDERTRELLDGSSSPTKRSASKWNDDAEKTPSKEWYI